MGCLRYAGGKAGWGVGLLFGLEHEGWFPGRYTGVGGSATAITATVSGTLLEHSEHGHRMRTMSEGGGLFAGAGSVRVDVTREDEAGKD